MEDYNTGAGVIIGLAAFATALSRGLAPPTSRAHVGLAFSGLTFTPNVVDELSACARVLVAASGGAASHGFAHCAGHAGRDVAARAIALVGPHLSPATARTLHTTLVESMGRRLEVEVEEE